MHEVDMSADHTVTSEIINLITVPRYVLVATLI